MKKVFFAALLCLLSFKLFAQDTVYTVYKSGNMYYAEAPDETGLSDLSDSDFVDLMDTVMGIVGRNGTRYEEGNRVLIKEGVFELTRTWNIPPTQDFELDAGFAILNYSATTGDAVTIDSSMNCKFTIGIVNPWQGTSGKQIRIYPRTQGPDSTIISCLTEFDFKCNGNNNGTALCLDTTYGDIVLNTFKLYEVTSTALGVEIPNPPSGKYVDANQFFITAHSLGNAIKIGTSTDAVGRIVRNYFNGVIRGNTTANTIGIDCYASNNFFNMSIAGYPANMDMRFASGTSQNVALGMMSDSLTDAGQNLLLTQWGLSLPHNSGVGGKNSAASPGNLIKRGDYDKTYVGESGFNNDIDINTNGSINLKAPNGKVNIYQS